MSNVKVGVAYGLSDALLNVPVAPIVSNRAPLAKDKAPLGTIWVNKPSNEAYVLTSVVANAASWVAIGGAGTFTNVDASGHVHAGADIVAGTTLTVGSGILVDAGGETITSGNLNVTAGDIDATAGKVTGGTLYAADDLGGVAATTAVTNVVDNTQSTGALTLVSASANPGTNAGFLKIYVGTTTAFVPYFTDIAP